MPPLVVMKGRGWCVQPGKSECTVRLGQAQSRGWLPWTASALEAGQLPTHETVSARVPHRNDRHPLSDLLSRRGPLRGGRTKIRPEHELTWWQVGRVNLPSHSPEFAVIRSHLRCHNEYRDVRKAFA